MKQKFLSVFCMAILVIASASCGDDDDPVSTQNGSSETSTLITNISLNKTSLTLTPNQSEVLVATVTPSSAYKKGVLKWTVSNSNVATSEDDGCIFAHNEGTATITVYATDGSGCKATCNLTVKEEDNDEYVDLGLPSGTIWATYNVGATSPEESGTRFAWGETTTKSSFSWSNYKWCNGSETTITKYYSSSAAVLEASDDAATEILGKKWCMPSYSQWQELISSCIWVWGNFHDTKGYQVTGPNGKYIFLPSKNGGSQSYWSNTRPTSNTQEAWHFTLSSSQFKTATTERYRGYVIRPVRAK